MERHFRHFIGHSNPSPNYYYYCNSTWVMSWLTCQPMTQFHVDVVGGAKGIFSVVVKTRSGYHNVLWCVIKQRGRRRRWRLWRRREPLKSRIAATMTVASACCITSANRAAATPCVNVIVHRTVRLRENIVWKSYSPQLTSDTGRQRAMKNSCSRRRLKGWN